ncbi:hypothetical protein [Mycetocola saprophilus]|uniref:hypothetical protein n=1 Tax=Mycetocola saprophilus TaxID=76636 RepID=UPI0012DF8FE8|nr:hypothetical protein [Mycetocola saprophilus]
MHFVKRPGLVLSLSSVIVMGVILASATPSLASSPESEAVSELKNIPAELKLSSSAQASLDFASSDGNTTLSSRGFEGSTTRVTISTGTESQGRVVVLEGKKTAEHQVEGYEVLKREDTGVSTFAKAIDGGAQIIFSGKNKAATEKFTLQFEQQITSIDSLGEGFQSVVFSDGTALVIQPAWAFDASGRALETKYEYSGQSLRQRVEVNADTKFPVSADPAWSYQHEAGVGGTTPTQARDALNQPGRFNQIFPVDGAPASIPSSGQLLPLTVTLVGPITANFNCTFGSQSYSNEGSDEFWSFGLNATQDHVDGAGSTIRFSVSKSHGDGSKRLLVYAKIIRSDPLGIGRQAYKDGAVQKWNQFASNLSAI